MQVQKDGVESGVAVRHMTVRDARPAMRKRRRAAVKSTLPTG